MKLNVLLITIELITSRSKIQDHDIGMNPPSRSGHFWFFLSFFPSFFEVSSGQRNRSVD